MCQNTNHTNYAPLLCRFPCSAASPTLLVLATQPRRRPAAYQLLLTYRQPHHTTISSLNVIVKYLIDWEGENLNLIVIALLINLVIYCSFKIENH